MSLLEILNKKIRHEKAPKIDLGVFREHPHDIKTPQGVKNIADLNIGDEVETVDFITGEKKTNQITGIEVLRQEPVYLLINGQFPLHRDQSVMMDDGTANHAFRLRKGDRIAAERGVVFIEKIERVHKKYPFVKLSIGGDHTYLMNGLLLHNASRYWVGGTTSWDGTAGTKWATTSGGAGGSSVPTTSDDVFLDGASGAVTVTIAAGNTGCLSLDCTGFTGTLAGSSALTIAGSLTLASGMTRTYTGSLTFSSTSTGRTLTLNGKTMASTTTFNGVGGGWTVQGAYNNGSGNSWTLTAGSLDTNGQTITVNNFTISGSTTRTCTLGASTITVNGAWNAATTTNLTFSGASSTINQSGSSVTFNGGGLTYGTVSLTNHNAIGGNNTFRDNGKNRVMKMI